MVANTPERTRRRQKYNVECSLTKKLSCSNIYLGYFMNHVPAFNL